ncbi:MAG TPA: OmpA family protein [Myxococcales bacterium]|nr:OmpA family protein [Myxococcales bacterium]
MSGRARGSAAARIARAWAGPIALCAALSGCATGSALRERARAIDQELSEARKQNAVRCAPRELAAAESNLRFASLELDQGDSSRASEHIAIAGSNAQSVVAQIKECLKLRVTPVTVGLKDTDGDGVPDLDDLCPDVPGPPSNLGCPLAVDTDGDGVADDIDHCPAVPGPRENFGCPWPDRDGDGVPDKDDLCPDEPGPPENQGCPRIQTLVIVRRDRIELRQQVHFAPTKSRILKDSYELLRQVAGAMMDAPAVKIRVEGHTDNVGNRASNLKLSQRRAEAVKKFLVGQGVLPRQLVAVGYGSKRPLASNRTRTGKAANRRVEFRMIEKKGVKRKR